jgi:hypothetical protein
MCHGGWLLASYLDIVSIYSFAEIGGCFLPDWLTGRVIEILMAQAAGLFIWAEIVVRFVGRVYPMSSSNMSLMVAWVKETTSLSYIVKSIILEHLFWEANNDTLNVLNQLQVMTTLILASYWQLALVHFTTTVISQLILDKLLSVIWLMVYEGLQIDKYVIPIIWIQTELTPQSILKFRL